MDYGWAVALRGMLFFEWKEITMVSHDTTGGDGGWPSYAQMQSQAHTIDERARWLVHERPFAALLAAAAAGYILARIVSHY